MLQFELFEIKFSEVLGVNVAVPLPSIVCAEVVAIVTVATPVFLTVYKSVLPTAVGNVNVVVPETRYM